MTPSLLLQLRIKRKKGRRIYYEFFGSDIRFDKSACIIFWDFDFCVTMRGDDVIKTLEIATNRWNDDGRPLLTCEHITKITYGKKVLYEKQNIELKYQVVQF